MSTTTPLKRMTQGRSTLTVTFTADEVAAAELQTLKEIASQMNIAGFRPGKAPLEVVKEKVKAEEVLEEVIRSLVPRVIAETMTNEKLLLAVTPRIQLEKKDPLTVAITFVERPSVKMKKLDTKTYAPEKPKVDEKDVERMVKYLLDQYRETTPLERAAAMGDQVTLNFVGHDAEGKELGGTRSTNHPLVLGSNQFIPGFEEALVGINKGETRKFTVTFPAEYHAEHLRSKPVTFTAEALQIDLVKLPELTDAFVKEKQLGDSPADVRSKLLKTMQEEELRNDKERRVQALMKAIVDATDADIAQEILDEEVQTLLGNIQRQLQERKMTLADWLKRTNRTTESLLAEFGEEAKRRVALRFGLETLINDRAITVTDSDIALHTKMAIEQADPAEQAQAEQFYSKGNEGYAELEWRAKVEKIVEMLLAESEPKKA